MTNPLDGFGVNLADVPLPKKRRTRHYKDELSDMERAYDAACAALRNAQERETTAALRLERAMYVAAMEEFTLARRVRFWRLVSLALALFGGLAVALLARVVWG